MPCPQCGNVAPGIGGRCAACGSVSGGVLDDGDGSTSTPSTDVGPSTSPPDSALSDALGHSPPGPASADAGTLAIPPQSASSSGLPSSAGLRVGEDFGSRYRIIRVLGAGGMGAVYQAWDKTLETAVAVKVIRPDAGASLEDAEATEKRFKRELLLARQVTHRNVVRIHDLGAIDGVTYITMPYVQGSDLATILKQRGRLPVERAVNIARQIAEGLEAAHDAGVIHRDLKPANVMIAESDHALIMDFGIARSSDQGTALAMTTAGGVIGTIDYMSPEQARAERGDHRCDIYSLGLIVYDMLSGGRQGADSNGVAGLVSRMQQPPATLRTVDSAIPEWLEAMVNQCLQPDPAARYQTVKDFLSDLDRAHRPPQTATAGVITTTAPAIAPEPPAKMWRRAAAAILFAIIAGAAWTQRDRFMPVTETTPSTAGQVLSLAVLPFRNASADATLDSLGPVIGQVLITTLGRSPHVRAVASERLHEVLQALHVSPNASLSPGELTRVADLTSAKRALWGQYARFGDAIRIDATLHDLEHQQTVLLNVLAPNQASLLPALAELSDAVAKALARGSPDVLAALKAASWKPSTNSFEALRLYNEGLRLSQQGTYQDALKAFEAAVGADERFALGYSALARTHATLGYDNEAEQFSRRAMALADALPPQEKYMIAANHYRLVNDVEKAIDSYENLAKASPNSASPQFDLGTLYEQQGRLDDARQRFARVVELDPKFVEGLLALGRVEIRKGNPQSALQYLNDALTLAIDLGHDESRASILQAIGIAYKNLNRPEEALPRYQESLDIKRRLGNKRGMASSLAEIAQVLEGRGRLKEAMKSYDEALGLQEEIGDRAGTSGTLVNMAALLIDNFARPDDALPLLRRALQIRRDAGNSQGEAMVLNMIGSAYFAKGDFSDAVTNFESALAIRQKANVPGEIADTLHNLAEASSRMGRYEQALKDYIRALELRGTALDKRGQAIERHSIGTVFDSQGRFGAAVESKGEALKGYRELKRRDMWLGEILSGLGYSLASTGRVEEAEKLLDEALSVARELQNFTLTAQTLYFQASNAVFRGNVGEASALTDQAGQAAKQSPDKGLTLQISIFAALMTASTQPSRAIATRLANLARAADALGLRALSVDASIARAVTLLRAGDRVTAREEIERTLARADALGAKLLLAKSHYARAEILTSTRDPQARAGYATALGLLNELRKEEGNQNMLGRADLSSIYEACERGAKGD